MRKLYMMLVVMTGSLLLIPFGFLLFILTQAFDRKAVVMNWYSGVLSWWLIKGNIGCRLTVEGTENIEEGKAYVVIANHSTMLDIPMVHFIPKLNFRWVSKREVLFIPIFGWVLAMQRSITIRRGDAISARAMMAKATKVLNKGVSVTVFPEGTRSKTGKITDFKPGAFIIAKSAEVDILPVMLYNAKAQLDTPLFKRVDLRVKILPPVSTAGRKLGELSNELNELYRTELD